MSPDPDELVRLGFEARRARDFKRALEHMRAAVSLSRTDAEAPVLARALSGLGQIERDLGNTASALVHYAEALSLARNR